MLTLGSFATVIALASSMTLAAPTPTPTEPDPTTSPSPTVSPTEEPTEEPTTPPAEEAKITVTPSTITTDGGEITVDAFCPDGTQDAVVTSTAFGRHALEGAVRITVQTVTGLQAGTHKVELLCDGQEVSAQTTLTVTAATARPTPSGPPQTGDGTTQGTDSGLIILVAGLGLVGAGAAAGTVVLRRRREGA